MENCSNTFPKTEDFYADLSSDIASIVFLTIDCILMVLCILKFLEEVRFLRRVYTNDEVRLQRFVIILGVFPVVIITSVISMLVPRSSILLDLIGSCYLSFCFYTFVKLTIDYFGGKSKMMEVFAGSKIQINTPPCCCCCCCVLKPIQLRRRPFRIFRFLALQVAIVQPFLVFIAAVLWTDGKYDGGMTSASSNTYMSTLMAISTLLSIYGTMVIYRASREHLKMFLLGIKFTSFYALFILGNIQTLIFSILSNYDLPECVSTRGPKVRGNAMNHSLIVIEAFLLALLGRKAYRRDETQIQGPVYAVEAGFSPFEPVKDQPRSSGTDSETRKSLGNHCSVEYEGKQNDKDQLETNASHVKLENNSF